MAVVLTTSPGFGKYGRVPDMIAERGRELARWNHAETEGIDLSPGLIQSLAEEAKSAGIAMPQPI